MTNDIKISHLANEIEIDDFLKLSIVSIERFEEFKIGVTKDFDHMKQWLPWIKEDIEGSSLEFYTQSINWKEQDKEVNWNILYDNKLVGAISFLKRDPSAQCLEIGYWLFSTYKGKGIITKCAKVLINLAFSETVTPEVMIACDKANDKSANVAKRLGFTLFREFKDEKLTMSETGVAQHYKFSRKEWENSI